MTPEEQKDTMRQNRHRFAELSGSHFTTEAVITDALGVSLRYSISVEQFIQSVLGKEDTAFALVSGGSFCRRELAPFSDIDLIFILQEAGEAEEEIRSAVQKLWDAGIEVSHTVRIFADIQRYFEEDLQSFTQFFELRFLLGNKDIFDEWNRKILSMFSVRNNKRLYEDFVEDMQKRYRKFGNSPKVIEPNVKRTCGSLRDFHMTEWIHIFFTRSFFTSEEQKTQFELFLPLIEQEQYTHTSDIAKLDAAYRTIFTVRTLLHLVTNQKSDRLEFEFQKRIADLYEYGADGYRILMKKYFAATSAIYRFNRTFLKRMQKRIYPTLPVSISIPVDKIFSIIAEYLCAKQDVEFDLTTITKAFYYRGLYDVTFEDTLRAKTLQAIDSGRLALSSGTIHYFRLILKLKKNVGTTLLSMNEVGVLELLLHEFKDLNGFIQHGVYHNYTADEHTLKTIENVELLENSSNTLLKKLYSGLQRKELLVLALLLHDIAKPLGVDGHEILGGETSEAVLERFGYPDEDQTFVRFLVTHHLLMSQTAFHRNLNEPETLNTFVSAVDSKEKLDYLFLLTYADLSAVNPALWTSWKNDMLNELYRKASAMLEDRITAEQLLLATAFPEPERISRHSESVSNRHVQEHFNSLSDAGYLSAFSEEEIALHITEIAGENSVSVLFKEITECTVITVLANDAPSLLAKLCGVLVINDANIHDAKIFTRKDGIIIDSFTVSDFHSHKAIDPGKYAKIESDFRLVLTDSLNLTNEFTRFRSRWKRLENKLFRRQGNIKIIFETLEKYTIIEVHSPDRIGFLFQVTSALHTLGLIIYFAKIATYGDEIIDTFYVTDRENKKVSENFFPMIETTLRTTIEQIF